MPKTVTLTLPWPPTANLYYRHAAVNGHAVTHLSPDGREYKALGKMVVRESKAAHFGMARLAVDITAFPPNHAARDLDNLLKPILDALSDEYESKKQAARRTDDARRRVVLPGIWCNDKQVDELRIRRGQVVSDGCVVISITELAAVAQQLELPAERSAEELALEPF